MKNPRIVYTTIFILFSLLAWIVIRENYPRRLLSRINHSAKDDAPAYWLNRDDLFESFPADTNSIIFFGTSLTQQFEVAELFNNPLVKNRGIVGDRTKTALRRLKPIVRARPKKIFIELGINDILEHVNSDTLLSNYSKILDILLMRTPRTRVFVQSILPVNAGSALPFKELYKDINEEINSINTRLEALCVQKNITFIDAASVFTRNGALDPLFTFDGVHLNGKAYLLWRDFLKPYVVDTVSSKKDKKNPSQ